MTNRTKRLLIFGLVGVTGILAGAVLVLGAMLARERGEPPTQAPVAEQASSATPSVTATEAPVAGTDTPQPEPPTATAPAVAAASPTPTVSPPPAPTAAPFITHTVVSGDTVIGIALGYNVSANDIVSANGLDDPNHIQIDQVLRIPVLPADVGVLAAATTPTPEPEPSETPAGAETEGSATATSTPTTRATTTATASAPAGNGDDGTFARPTAPANWPPSAISGDLAANYPLIQQTASGELLIHYQYNTYVADNVQMLATTLDDIWAELQRRMRGQVGRQVDVYLGGTLFSVNPALQGYTQSYEFRTFILVNGAFHPGERNYILGHELTHVAATHILGPASSTMIHEGLAAYLPQRHLVEEAGYLPIEEICAAAYQTDAFRSATELSQLAYGANAFGGHIRTFFNYNLSGCFVGYLLEEFNNGMERLNQVYDSGDYAGVYGMTLGELDQAWQESLATVSPGVDAVDFVDTVEEVAAAYERYVSASAGGHHDNYEAYLHLNQARLAANRGDLDEARAELEIFWSLVDF